MTASAIMRRLGEIYRERKGPSVITLDAPPYVYYWHRMGRKGQLCRVIARGSMNSCLVEFEDGFKAVTSRNALRRNIASVAKSGVRG